MIKDMCKQNDCDEYKLKDWTFTSHNDITDAMALSWGYREKQKLENKSSRKKVGHP